MPQPFELDDTRPPAGPSPLVSVEEARLFHSVRSRLFDGREDPLRLGTYRVLRRLGGGGMGEVFLAHDDELDRPVALKLVHARLGHDDHFAARMRREARALARLAHPNVVHVYEVGEHQGRVFIAMEYVQGQSLAGWIRDHAPRWQAVLDAYLAAGEGLAAAHAAGLTHRDFKPDNVLRGADGRVRVADFGLARVEGGATDPPADTPASDPSGKHAVTLDQRLSATGGVMGTLDYMPLEQVRGGTVDARSDQFAFCVALYAGLWGRLPHAAASLGERERVLVEVRPAVPPPAVVPGWVWPIVQRGLARDPAQRWPDMRTLLDRLRRTPVRRRARRRAVATLLGLSLAAGGGWAALAPAPLCTPDASALAGTWDEPRRLAVRAAFTATGERFADESAARVERSLDAWAAKWTAARAENCAASRIQGVQSESTLDRRTACLERQRREVGALVTTLAHADARAVARAGEALRGLPELGACSVQAIDAQAEPVVAPTDRDAVDAGYDALGAAHSALNLGQVDLAVELAGRARVVGESRGHLPLALEAQVVLARVATLAGELDRGVELLRTVTLAAERARLLDLVATARVALARAAAGKYADPRLERWLVDEAELDLQRVARPDDPRAALMLGARARLAEQAGEFATARTLHQAAHALAEGRMDDGERALLRIGVGTALYREGKLEAARAELEQTRDAVTAAWGPGAPEAARIDADLAMIATDLGEYETAERHIAAALASDERTWGRGSLEVTRDRFVRAYLAFGRGELAAGCALVDEVEAVYEAKLGRVHDETAIAINAAAVCRYHAEDFLGALDGFQRALDVQTRLLGERHREVALLHANIGEARFALGRYDEALAAYTRALEILRATASEDHPELANPLKGQALVWLARGEPARALPGLRRALELVDASRAGEAAEIRFGIARALVAVHGRPERATATALARAALAEFEAAGLARQTREVREWLAKHRP